MDSQITVGGLEPDSPPPSPRGGDGRLIAFVAAAAVIGAVLGAAFTSPGTSGTDEGDDSVGDVGEPAAVTTTTLATTTTQPDRLAVRVPGFIDVLVLESSQLGAETGTFAWEPADRGPVDRSLPAIPKRADAGQTWLSGVGAGRFSPLNVLWVGNDRWMEPVATGVTEAAWHERFPGRLAWVEHSTEGLLLVVGSFQPGRPASTVTAALGVETAAPVWFGDSGVLLDVGDGLFHLVSVTGAVVAEYEADRFLAGGPDSFLLVRDDRVESVSEVLPTWTTTLDARCTTGEFSPANDGTVAVRCPAPETTAAAPHEWSVQVWHVSAGSHQTALLYTHVAEEVTAPTWSSDGRFAVTADQDATRIRSNVVFLEVGSWIDRSVPVRGIVTSIAALRG